MGRAPEADAREVITNENVTSTVCACSKKDPAISFAPSIALPSQNKGSRDYAGLAVRDHRARNV